MNGWEWALGLIVLAANFVAAVMNLSLGVPINLVIGLGNLAATLLIAVFLTKEFVQR